MRPYEGQTLVIATKHGKENVMAPLLEEALGVKCVVPEGLDTDVLGTFTGEVERTDDPLVTARRKCAMALEQTGADLAVANEGTFGPHPTLFFQHCDDELIYFLDRREDLHIFTRFMTTETNFNGAEVNRKPDLMRFAEAVRFPSHALILRPGKERNERIVKGLHTWPELLNAWESMLTEFGQAYAETDMRAMHNPMRMEFIGKVTQRLLDKIASCCPSCGLRGFGITALREGLPCELCGTPTASALSYISECGRCGHVQEQRFPHGKEKESPMYCSVCNP
jgi:hypothetical protein